MIQGDLAYKIPDPTGQFINTIPRPFDLFGSVRGLPWYCEVKFLNKLQSFDLQRIEDHQIQNLLDLKEKTVGALCWIVLAVKVARGDSRFYIFKDILDIAERRKNKRNYLKKELETLTYYTVRKNLIEGDFCDISVPMRLL